MVERSRYSLVLLFFCYFLKLLRYTYVWFLSGMKRLQMSRWNQRMSCTFSQGAECFGTTQVLVLTRSHSPAWSRGRRRRQEQIAAEAIIYKTRWRSWEGSLSCTETNRWADSVDIMLHFTSNNDPTEWHFWCEDIALFSTLELLHCC